MSKLIVFLFLLLPSLTFGQQTDTVRIHGHQLLVADTLIAKFVRVNEMNEKNSSYSLKQIAVVFEREQFLQKHGLASETLLLQHYPTTEWSLLPYYRNKDGRIREVVSFDYKQIEKAWLKERHRKAGGGALVLAGLLSVAYGLRPLPEPQTIGQGIGQEIGRRTIPIFGAVSIASGLILLGK